MSLLLSCKQHSVEEIYDCLKRPETSLIWLSRSALILSTLSHQRETLIWRRTLYLVCTVSESRGSWQDELCFHSPLWCSAGINTCALAAILPTMPPKEFIQTFAFISKASLWALMPEKHHRLLLSFDFFLFSAVTCFPSSLSSSKNDCDERAEWDEWFRLIKELLKVWGKEIIHHTVIGSLTE